MNVFEKQIKESVRRLAVLEAGSSKNGRVTQMPYLYITHINKSIKPPCCKVGYSGKDDFKGPEDILKKLRRYSTPLPDDWRLHAMLFFDCDAHDMRKYEDQLFDALAKHGSRIAGKELFEMRSDKDIDTAITQFICDVNDDGNLSDIFKCYFYDKNKFYSPRVFLPKAEVKESVDPQIHYWAHMLDECFNKEQFLCEDREDKTL